MSKISIFMFGMIILMTSCQQNETKEEVRENPFFTEWDTPFGVPPFDKIKDEDFKPAFEKAIENQNKEIEAIVNNPEPATFKNTVVALDKSGSDLHRVSGVFFNLTEANTNESIAATNA
ncbi:MAG: peptidase M3, partial [Bacteroidales bacterium]|nr:peptidase M3 [Bacteroidales bacterium]